MRVYGVTLATLAALACGCTEFAFVTQPPPRFLSLETWKTLPVGQHEVTAKVGDTLHLPLDRSVDPADPLFLLGWKVTVNGERAERQSYFAGSVTTYYVFRAERPGDYRLEVAADPPVGKGQSLVWDIKVCE